MIGESRGGDETVRKGWWHGQVRRESGGGVVQQRIVAEAMLLKGEVIVEVMDVVEGIGVVVIGRQIYFLGRQSVDLDHGGRIVDDGEGRRRAASQFHSL